MAQHTYKVTLEWHCEEGRPGSITLTHSEFKWLMQELVICTGYVVGDPLYTYEELADFCSNLCEVFDDWQGRFEDDPCEPERTAFVNAANALSAKWNKHIASLKSCSDPVV